MSELIIAGLGCLWLAAVVKGLIEPRTDNETTAVGFGNVIAALCVVGGFLKWLL